MIVWLDGDLVDENAASVPVTDVGLSVGDGLFETLAIVAGGTGAPAAFALGRHLRRLRAACARTGVAEPPPDLLRTAVERVLDAFGEPGGRLRITVTGSATLLVTASVAVPPRASAAVAISPWVRNERSPMAGIKSTSYAENAVALRWARAAGFDEAVMGNTRGEVCEGTATNVFVGLGGALTTPPLASGCLPGVTRELLLEAGIGLEQTMSLDVLDAADEVFLTSSLRGVQPVARIGRREIEEVPGPLTRAAAASWSAVVAAGSDP